MSTSSILEASSANLSKRSITFTLARNIRAFRASLFSRSLVTTDCVSFTSPRVGAVLCVLISLAAYNAMYTKSSITLMPPLAEMCVHFYLVALVISAFAIVSVMQASSTAHTSSRQTSVIENVGVTRLRSVPVLSSKSTPRNAIVHQLKSPDSISELEALSTRIMSQWISLRSWAENSTHMHMLAARTAAAASFISEELEQQIIAHQNLVEANTMDETDFRFQPDSRLLFRVNTLNAIVLEIKRLPMSQPGVVVQSFVERCKQSGNEACFEIVARYMPDTREVVYYYASYRCVLGLLPSNVRELLHELLRRLNGLVVAPRHQVDANRRGPIRLSMYRLKNYVSKKKQPPIQQILD